MGVHITKCGLKWIYGRNVSSDNNVRFYAYCAHFPGIDTPSQKIHDDEVRKLDMCLFVEELRENRAMIYWRMVFGVVFPEVGASRGPVNLELTLTSTISDTAEAHVNCLWPFLIDGIVWKFHCCGVIYLYGVGGLGMSEFFEGCADW